MTPEYIELCREANLPRELRRDDWVVFEGEIGPRLLADQKRLQPPLQLDPSETGASLVWLPREGDLLDLLEAEGAISVWVTSSPGEGYWAGLVKDGKVEPSTGSPDRCAALLRLLLAVSLPTPSEAP